MIKVPAPSFRYRPDIDGLRALAVVPVCLYHAGTPGFPGGFVGVDVFFVISGFLMASLISRDLDGGGFSLRDFYERRARRILPALFGMLAFCCVAAACLVSPKLFRDFGATLIATVLFASNLLFWRKSENYFEAPTDWNPLAHTWSLGVEEQFYIVFPLLLMLLWRWRPGIRIPSIAVLALASLVLSIWGTANAPTATFYLLPTRGWELLLGALVAFIPFRTSSDETLPRSRWGIATLLALAGVGLIIWSVVDFDGGMAFPGAAALVPCLGAAILLSLPGGNTNAVSGLLSLRPFVFVGRISYSLYLWHWPLLVFVDRYFAFGSLSSGAKLAIVAASFMVAYGSWRWVEQPFRSRHGREAGFWNTSRVFGAAAALTAALALAGVGILEGQGWPQRFPGLESVSLERQMALEARDDPAWQNFDERRCFMVNAAEWGGDACDLNPGSKAGRAILWGDSFAWAWAYGFFRSGGSQLEVLQYTSPQCPPILGYHAASHPQCDAFDRDVAMVARRHGASTVIMAANWSTYLRRGKFGFRDVADTVAALHRAGLRVILIGQSPVFPFAYPDEYYFRKFPLGTEQPDYFAPLNAAADFNARMSEAAHADVFFDALKSFCRGSECVFKEGDHYLVEDYGHWTHFGSVIAVGRLLASVKR